MKRFSIRPLLATALIASVVSAQNPVTTTSIGDQTGSVGGAAISIDLRSHFAMDGVTTPLVRFDTVFGKFDVELLEEHAPNHVTNFLRYTDGELYDNTFFHRTASFTSSAPAITQGGGFYAVEALTAITSFGNVDLEYSLPNTRGTLAAARTSNINTANAQFFFNTEDNTATLGPDNNSGFTAYGRVLGNGMDVVDVIASINRFNLDGGVFSEIPLRFFSGGAASVENLVTIDTVRRVDIYPTGGDNDSALTFSATSSDETVVLATINGSTLQLTPVSTGSATISVNATDISDLVVTQEISYLTGGLAITSQPSSANVAAGGAVSLTVAADSDAAITYQWYRQKPGESSAQLLTGETAASLSIASAAAGDMGFYWAKLTSGGNEVNSGIAIVTLSGGTSRLANLSTRGRIPANGALTPGFVMRGTGTKPLVVRAVGPQLLNFGVQSALTDPKMEIIPAGASEAVATNDNWGDAANSATLVTTSASLGAFALDAGSADAAILTDLPLPNTAGSRGYTVRITATDSASAGIALAEVYDPEAIGGDLQLTNVSALGFSGLGEDVLAPGFVIDGTGAKTMLIRVVGPSLENFGVTGTMTDPKLSLIPAGQTNAIATNDNWGGTAALKAAFATTGAFELDSDASADAVILVRLPPGAYTVKPEGADGGTGTILVEAYEVIE
ncbi:MAG: hypothetical protein HOH58_09450 [Opitutaceae bacterium]|jgi:cyclophilin family peptidyl-prolyl cis-trans isomerase|nr:hypothetical protein [Opitutaceae bacterium]